MFFSTRLITGPVNRALATAQNGMEVLRLGGLETENESAPYEVVERRPMYRLRRYFPEAVETTGGVSDRPVVLLIPPMMMSADVYDVTRDKGAAGVLHDAGIDPWVIDFGSPDREDGGLARNLADHIVAISQAVDTVVDRTGRQVHLSGYSQGGMFAYQAAALRQSKDLASVITFGSPVDTLAALPFGLPSSIASWSADFLADNIISRVYLPGWAARMGFQMFDPAKTAKSRIDFVRQLHDRDALLPREAQRRFLERDGFVAYSGPAIAELLKQFIAHNRMMTGGFVIDGRLVSLAEITCPVLSFIGEVDDIGQPVAVRGIVRAAPHADVYERTMTAGHFGLVVGSTAAHNTWPDTAAWMHWREAVIAGADPVPARPEEIGPMQAAEAGEGQTGVSVSSRVTHTVTGLAEVGLGAARGLAHITSEVGRSTAAIAEEAVRTLPRLARLGQMQPHTRISLGSLMAEQAERAPEGECFVFEDRVHTNTAVAERIDNVVRGLISLGVRQGSEIGVLMETRPSALATIAALSRIGAVAVLLPVGTGRDEALALTDVQAIVADPDHLADARETGCPVYVLGGGDERDLNLDPADTTVVDMERIDPSAVSLPRWYRPDPGLARDLAFIMFGRVGGKLEARRITNRRWALSAFGTASAASLDSGDTVYCLTPLNHPSGLLTSLGGAVAGGSRIALTGRLDPQRFAAEVQRYGVTVVSYTWTQLAELAQDPACGLGRHHPIRLFIGSGMPLGLWNEVTERFAPAQVVEFYASSEGGAVLANLSTAKPGSKGRPLPGSAKVALATYDPIAGRYVEERDGLLRRAEQGEVGRLLSKARTDLDTTQAVLRGVFEPGDAWMETSDLFYVDGDGDYWMVDTVDSVVRSPRGPVYTLPIVDAVGRLSEVTGSVAYGVPIDGATDGAELAVLAVTVRDGHELTAGALDEALGKIPGERRPDVVRVVDKIPSSRWFRPLAAELREEGVPPAGPGVFALDPQELVYRTAADADAKDAPAAAR